VLTRMACTRARRCRMFVVAGLQIHVSMREEHARTITYRDDGVGRSSCYTCSHVHAAAAAVDRRIESVGEQALFTRLCDPMAGNGCKRALLLKWWRMCDARNV
jgi:hypothetical protein